jgi:Family of unknown function (DUF5681)
MVWKSGQSGNPAGRKPGTTNQKGDRIRAAFVRMFDADPRKLDKMALACWEKAVAGDVPAQTFIRDTMDGKPIQRTDAVIAHQSNRSGEELSDEELAARIAELEDRLAAEDDADKVAHLGAELANGSEDAGTTDRAV